MKKLQKSKIGLVIVVIGTVLFFSEAIFGINLLTLVVDDSKAPIIYTADLTSAIVLNGEFDTSSVTCDDNLDRICEVEIQGAIDSSIVGVQTITFYAVDSSGNEVSIPYEVTVYAGLDTSIYIPNGYYDGIETLSGDPLKDALNDIITNHTEFPYTNTNTDVWDMLRDADEDPNNPDNIILFYSGYSWPKDCQDTVTPPDYCVKEIDGEMKSLEWNREHIWSKSRGEFEHEDGASAYAMGAHTDAHHLVAAERRMNSTKSNRMFEDCHDGDDINLVDRGYGNWTCNDWQFEPRDEVKGDVARMIFYMAVRYEGELGDYVDLEVINDADDSRESKLPYYGDLDDLLRWHLEDPVSEWEIERNQVIFTYQGNRNPFIDDPELAHLIWGDPEDYE